MKPASIIDTIQPWVVSNYYLTYHHTFRNTPASYSLSLDEVFVSGNTLITWIATLMRAVYIFVGCLMLSNFVLRYIAGSIVILVGIGYVVLEFMPQVEPPSNMRDADAGWGAEQV